ncbi:unnamed protein product [Adineta steineri]|uniref:HTH OST-type domain-containing protein n=1 Tax=Adineta steineri TaxID=433720 RepID=A0A815MJ40_9BILA|nr:unnamed protein product [Adineta steineri]
MATALCISSPPIYDSVKDRIKYILSTHVNSLPTTTDGLTLTELCKEYERRYDTGELPYRELGFETLTRFLSSMKDVVRMDLTEWPAKCHLRIKTNEQTEKRAKIVAHDTHSSRKEDYKRQFKSGSSVAYTVVKNNIISLLQTSLQNNNNSSLTLTELCHQYSNKNSGQPLPYEQLGYSTLEDLLESMRNRIRVDNRRCYLITNKNGPKKGENTSKYRED